MRVLKLGTLAGLVDDGVTVTNASGLHRVFWFYSAGIATACFRAATALAVCTTVLAGCSADPIPMPMPAMQLMAPAVLPVPQDIVVPLPVPAEPPPVARLPRLEGQHGMLKFGKPYQVAGNWYYPTPGAGYDEEGIASWYGPDFNGKSTANGETYNMHHLSAAHPTLPMPCYVEVTNASNGRTLVVRVNDRGPYKHGRILDLSKRAAQLLGVTRFGTAQVRVRYLKMAPLIGNDDFAERFLARQPWYHPLDTAEIGRPLPVSPVRIRASATELPAMDPPAGDSAWASSLQQP
jgi:rare lipoprotein A